MAGVTASIDFIAGMDHEATGSRRERIVKSMQALENYEHPLFEYMENQIKSLPGVCLLYTSPSPRDRTRSRMPSSA